MQFKYEISISSTAKLNQVCTHDIYIYIYIKKQDWPHKVEYGCRNISQTQGKLE